MKPYGQKKKCGDTDELPRGKKDRKRMRRYKKKKEQDKIPSHLIKRKNEEELKILNKSHY